MTDVRLSITLDAEQAKRSAADFRAGFKALTGELRQPLGQAPALNQVRVGAIAATGATLSLNSAYGQQQASLSGLSSRQVQAAAATRQLATEQRQLAGAAVQATQAVTQQARAAGASAAMGGNLGASIRGAIGTYAGVQTVAAITRTADAYTLMLARLRLATQSQEEFNGALQGLQRIATANAAPVASLVSLYSRLSIPLREAGRSQTEILQVIEAVTASFRVSGAGAQEAEAAILQFAQAMGSGVLRGDEFNSVAEQAPALMQALAAGLGVATSELRGMAEAGELTASVVADALIGQLDQLRERAASMPETVGAAMTRLRDAANEAVGQADLSPLIEAIDQLGDTLSDPAVIQGVASLAAAMATLASVAVSGGSEFGNLGKRIGFLAASAVGGVTEIDKLAMAIEDTKRSLNGTGLSTTLDGLIYSEEELKARLAAQEAALKLLLDQQSGMNDALRQQQAEANAAAAAQLKQKREALQKHANEMKAVRDQLVKDADAALKAEKKAESDALRDLERIKQDRVKLEQMFNASIANTGVGTRAPSYGAAQALKVKARRSLASGDTDAAIEQAKAALRVLEQLEDAGENTYGFQGFKASLRDIALAAKDLEQTEAERKLADIGAQIKTLEQQAADLEEVKITPQLSDAAVAAVTAQLQTLAASLGQTLTIPVRLVPDASGVPGSSQPATSTDSGAPPLKRATGGWIDGPGTPTSDSVLLAASRGEYVLSARAAAMLGAANLDFMNRSGQLPMRDHLIPEIPSLPALARMGERQPLNLAMPWGGSYALDGAPAEVQRFQDDLRRAARKFGRTHT